MTTSLVDAGRVFVDPSAYADEQRFHEACSLLRRADPVHRVEEAGFHPFWAITRHSDVLEIERHHERFVNAPRPILVPAEQDDRRRAFGDLVRTLVHMDEPDHRVYRALAAEWFKPASLRRLEERMRELARRYVDRMMELGGACDFASDVAAHYPLSIILSILGLPESDHARMLTLTQELFGNADPERQRGATPAEQLQTLLDFAGYFNELTADRRSRPTDDLASVIANATIDGEPINPIESTSYYILIATAGHDTTSSSIAGGLHALLAFPQQLARLQADPALLPSAVEEMIRWVTPVKQFMRTATEEAVIGGKTIAPGDAVLLSYPSANRDEDVFANPSAFDVARDPNRHVGFGFGIHHCLGAQLARMEARILFAELLPRLRHIELAGEPAWLQTLFVGGLKRLPVSYELAPHAGPA